MHFSAYQSAANETDQRPGSKGNIIPLLGLAGEVGTLLAEYKKFIRDGHAHKTFKEQVEEELGDILWYMANAATRFGLELESIAEKNLKKTHSRWHATNGQTELNLLGGVSDAKYPEHERLPRRFRIRFVQQQDSNLPKVRLFCAGVVVGDDLTDNSKFDDGYRFHDAFHFANAALLGWSPVTRAILKRKRKSDPKVDMNEDGGRAIVIEEGIVAYVYDYGRRHNYLEDVEAIDFTVLRTIKSLTQDLEVRDRTAAEWEAAIVAGFAVWRHLNAKKGGYVTADLDKRTISFRR